MINLSDILEIVILTFPIWLASIVAITRNNKGKVIERRGNYRIKEGEKCLCRGSKYATYEDQYRKQRRVLGIWFTVKWYSIGNYQWMKTNGFNVI